MHELAITEGIIRAAIPEAEKYGAKRILKIHLKIGELSGVLPECIQYYFDIASKGTIAEKALLTVEKIPAAIACPDCGYEGAVDRKKIRCPQCGGINFRLTGGREYFVDSMEAE